MDDQTILKNCRLLLTKYPKLRNPLFKKQRVWAYWKEFEGIRFEIIETEFYRLTDGESISRAYRKVLELNPHLRAPIEQQQIGAELAEKHRLAFKK